MGWDGIDGMVIMFVGSLRAPSVLIISPSYPFRGCGNCDARTGQIRLTACIQNKPTCRGTKIGIVQNNGMF